MTYVKTQKKLRGYVADFLSYAIIPQGYHILIMILLNMTSNIHNVILDHDMSLATPNIINDITYIYYTLAMQ